MKLNDLITMLTEIYNQNGNMNVEIMREGEHFQEVGTYTDDNTLYIEAYKDYED
jgi:uncharacterized protein YacL